MILEYFSPTRGTLEKRMNKISFTAKEDERTLSHHHDFLVISLTRANCLVKRVFVDNGSSSNIIFHTAYHDLALEEGALKRRVSPLISFSGEVKQTSGVVTLLVYVEGINISYSSWSSTTNHLIT